MNKNYPVLPRLFLPGMFYQIKASSLITLKTKWQTKLNLTQRKGKKGQLASVTSIFMELSEKIKVNMTGN